MTPQVVEAAEAQAVARAAVEAVVAAALASAERERLAAEAVLRAELSAAAAKAAKAWPFRLELVRCMKRVVLLRELLRQRLLRHGHQCTGVA